MNKRNISTKIRASFLGCHPFRVTLLLACLLAWVPSRAGEAGAPVGGYHPPPPNWSLNPTDYQFNMNMIVRVRFEGVANNAPGSLVGVFVGSELRGVASGVAIAGQIHYFLTIYSNVYTGEVLRFRTYFAPNDAIYASAESVVFTHHKQASTLEAPFWINIDPNADFAPELAPLLADTTLQNIPFEPIELDAYLNSLDGDPVSWSAQAGPNLTATILNGVLTVTPVSPAWIGTDTVRIIVTENTANQKADTIVGRFTVLADYGPPMLLPIPSQSTFPQGAFIPFDLDNYLVFNGPCHVFDLDVFPYTGAVPDPAWPAVPPAAQPMSVVMRPLFADEQLAGSGAKLAAFVNNILVGTATPVGVSPNVSYTLSLQNLAAGTITFRFYHAENQWLYEKSSALVFVPGGSAGSVAAPLDLQLSPLLPSLALDGTIQVDIVDSMWIGTFPVDFIVWDCRFPALRRDTTSALFSVVVDDRPHITSPATVSFQENACYALYDAQATDPQDSEGSGLTYSLSGGADVAKFSIDPSNGKLSWFNYTPDFETPGDANNDNQYEVTIRVTNSMNLTDELALVVTVTDATPDVFLPQVNGGATAVCLVNNAVLQATGGNKYHWNSGDPSATISVSNTGTYTVTISNDAGCSAVITIVVTNRPSVTASGSAVPVCAGSNISLNATPTGGSGVYTAFSWAGPNGFTAVVEDPAPFPAMPLAAGTYTVTVTDNTGCTASATTVIDVSGSSAPTVVASNNGPLCAGTNILLNATPSGGTGTYTQFKWAGPSYTASGQAPTGFAATLAAAGTYTVTVTDNMGCTGTSTTAVQVKPLPSIVAASNTPICIGKPVSLSSTPSGGSGTYTTFSWAGPNTFTAAVEDPGQFSAVLASGGTYTVTVTDNMGCTAKGTTTVSVNGPPTVVAALLEPVCTGGMVALGSTPTGGSGTYAFQWVGPNGFTAVVEDPAAFPVTPLVAGSYTVTVTDGAGCSAISSVTAVVNPIPSITATNAGPVCQGTNLLLFSTPSAGTPPYALFEWTGPDNYTASIEDPAPFTTTQASFGVYQVKVTDSKGCTATATTSAAIFPKPTIVATNTGPLCTGANINLMSTPSGGSGVYASFAWTMINGAYTANQEDPPGFPGTPAQTGTYQVVVTDNAGCTAIATTNVAVSTNIAPTITAMSNAPLCGGLNLVLTSTASGGSGVYSNFKWSGPNGYNAMAQNPPPFIATAAATGTYTVTVTDNKSCTNTASAIVVVSAVEANPTANNPVCEGTMVQLNAGASGGSGVYPTINWSGPNGYLASGEQPAGFVATPAVAGTYTVTVTDNAGCNDTGTVVVSVEPNDPPTITCPSDQELTASNTCSVMLGNWVGFATNVTDDCTPQNALVVAQMPAATTLLSTHDQQIVVTLTAYDGLFTVPCTFKVTLKDRTPPTITCPANTSVSPTSTTPCFAVVTGINATYNDNCTAVLTYTLSNATVGTGTGQLSGLNFLPGETTVVYTVTDGALFSSSCSFTVRVRPCQITFSGRIIWKQDNVTGVKDATVTLSGDQTATTLSNVTGNYSMTVPAGYNFMITPTKNLNKLNGITSADAFRIQLHLSSNLITDPWQLIAADVSLNNVITSLDANIIQLSLLNNPQALTQFAKSWRFVPTSYAMTNPPWGFPEKITLTNVYTPTVPNQDFYGVKVGDVAAPYANPANGGHGLPLVLNAEDAPLWSGDSLSVNVTADALPSLGAFQFALQFDHRRLQWTGIESLSGLPMTGNNWSVADAGRGFLRFVWVGSKAQLLPEGAPLFRLRFKVLQSGGQLSEALRLDDETLRGLVCNGQLAESDVLLRFHSTTSQAEPGSRAMVAALLQNRPNPFRDQTTIAFVLPEACEARLRIVDAGGRVVATRSKYYPEGQHQEAFDIKAVSGVLYYELTTPFGVVTRKMLAGE